MIIDTNRRTGPHLDCLVVQGVQTVIRYYARTTQQSEKRLTRAEADAILAAGASIAVVHQAGGSDPDSFGRNRGLQDARYALDYATQKIGQPAGSAIYFAVDFDCDAQQLNSRIIPHFEAIRDVLGAAGAPKPYEIGAYGNGLVLEDLLNRQLCRFAWLSQSTGHHGSKAFKNSNRWTLFQRLPSMLCGIGVDVDDLNPDANGFGQFQSLDPLGPSAGSAAAGRFRTIATDGLRLRAGPGTDFAVLRLLRYGTLVQALKQTGNWTVVDVDGSGGADGAVHSAFLEPAP